MKPLSLEIPEIKFEIAGVYPLVLEAQGGVVSSAQLGRHLVNVTSRCDFRRLLSSLDPQDLVNFQSAPPSRSCRARQETWESSMLNLGMTSLDRRRGGLK
jgi:hypothetical protein